MLARNHLTLGKLKIGVLINDESITWWNYAILEKLLSLDFVTISLIVKRSSSKKNISFASKVFSYRKTLSWIMYERLDKKLFAPSHNAFENKSILKLLPDTPVISVTPKETKFSDRFSENDIANINEHKLDIFVRFGFRILRGKVLKLAKYGIWSYHHGDSGINRGGPAGFWELAEQWKSTSATLQILSEDLDGGLVLEKSHSQTDKISLIRNKNLYYWNAVYMLPRQVEELNRLGDKEYFKKKTEENSDPVFYSNRLFKKPSNFTTFLVVTSLFYKKLKEKLWRVFNFEQWVLLYHFSKSNSISKSLFRFKKITPPKDRFWADPFVVYHDQKYFLFIEELIYKHGLGHISVMELDKSGHYTQPQPVIQEDYHLSYPFILKHEGTYFMLPESKSNKSIDLYKCSSFPNKWTKHMTLMKDIEAVDSTLFYKDDCWWLFANVVNYKGASSLNELCLFYSDNLFSDNWTKHPKSPIFSDASKARPAGKIFEYNGKLYRPSQNCSIRYGYGLKINRIDVLTKTEYQEETIQEINPSWDKSLVGVHTLNHSNKLTVSDAIFKRSKFK